jgi:hypothetical protein
MDKLERLLHDPASHGPVPSAADVRAWSEAALERWEVEDQGAPTAATTPLERFKSVVFWLTLAACLAYMVSLLWTLLGETGSTLREGDWNLPTSADVGLVIETHATTIALVIAAASLVATRPVREFLLDQLD